MVQDKPQQIYRLSDRRLIKDGFHSLFLVLFFGFLAGGIYFYRSRTVSPRVLGSEVTSTPTPSPSVTPAVSP